MPAWKPEATVGASEHIGRRLYDEPMLAGARDQKRAFRLELFHFEEDRGDEYSVDRLGRTGVEKKITRFLGPRIESHRQAFKPPKRFDGWATIRAKDLTAPTLGPKFPKWGLVADPIQGEPPNDNEYHAHALPPNNLQSEFAAFHLRHHFEKSGKIFDPHGIEINFAILTAMPKLSVMKRCQVSCKKHFGRLMEKLRRK